MSVARRAQLTVWFGMTPCLGFGSFIGSSPG